MIRYRAVLAAAALLASAFVSTAAPAGTEGPPPEVANRLPTFCRYTIDVSRSAHPYNDLEKAGGEEDVTCPFAAGVDKQTRLYRMRGQAPCSAADLPGLTVIAAEEMTGRAARAEKVCAVGSRAAPPPASLQGGAEYLVHYFDEEGSFLLPTGGWTTGTNSRTGAPFARFNMGTKGTFGPVRSPTEVILCFSMIPAATTDPKSFLKGIGHPLPADATQERITGRTCAEAAKTRYGVEFTDGAEATEFDLWLKPSDGTPVGRRFDAMVMKTFADLGVTRASGGRTYVQDKEIVLRTAGGAPFGVIGGQRQLMIHIRALDPQVCAVLYALGEQGGLFIDTSTNDWMSLKTPSAGPTQRAQQFPVVAVTGAGDLCAMLKPGFDEWRVAAVPGALDLMDLDDQNSSLGPVED